MEPLRFPAEQITPRRKLFDIIRARSFGRRRVKLASGRESDFYFDMKPTMFHPEGAALITQLFLERLQNVAHDCVGGVAVGAVPLVANMVMGSEGTGRPKPGFFVRKAVKEHGTQRKIEALSTSDLEGKRVVILEDVTTTGQSSLEAVEAAQAAGATIVLVLAVVDREEGASEFYASRGLPFDSLFKANEFLRT